MLSHLMEALLLVLIASSRNVESSTGSVAGSNGKPFVPQTNAKNFSPLSEPENVSLVLFVISRWGRPTSDMRRNQINLIIIVGYDYGIAKSAVWIRSLAPLLFGGARRHETG